jgi:TonB family protein
MVIMRTGVLIVAFILALWSNLADGQNTTVSSGSERKVSSRVAPAYPELAKKMHIRGVVRIEAIVRANGNVKSTRVLGGNPVLVEAAQDAVGKWKFEPGVNETTEIVQLAFEGQ